MKKQELERSFERGLKLRRILNAEDTTSMKKDKGLLMLRAMNFINLQGF